MNYDSHRRRYPVNTGYQARRKARRATIKARLLPILRRLEARGEHPDMAALAKRFDCGASTLRQMRAELGQEGRIADVDDARRERLKQGPMPDLAERIAAVREAKLARWVCEQRQNLTTAELDEVLP